MPAVIAKQFRITQRTLQGLVNIPEDQIGVLGRGDMVRAGRLDELFNALVVETMALGVYHDGREVVNGKAILLGPLDPQVQLCLGSTAC